MQGLLGAQLATAIPVLGCPCFSHHPGHAPWRAQCQSGGVRAVHPPHLAEGNVKPRAKMETHRVPRVWGPPGLPAQPPSFPRCPKSHLSWPGGVACSEVGNPRPHPHPQMLLCGHMSGPGASRAFSGLHFQSQSSPPGAIAVIRAVTPALPQATHTDLVLAQVHSGIKILDKLHFVNSRSSRVAGDSKFGPLPSHKATIGSPVPAGDDQQPPPPRPSTASEVASPQQGCPSRPPRWRPGLPSCRDQQKTRFTTQKSL